MAPTVEGNDSIGQRNPSAGKVNNEELLERYERIRKEIEDELGKAYKGEASNKVIVYLEELKSVYDVLRAGKVKVTKVQLADAESLMNMANLAAINARNLKMGDVGMALQQGDFVTHMKKYLNGGSGSGSGGGENEEDEDFNENGGDRTSTNAQEEVFNSFDWPKLGSFMYKVTGKPLPMQFLNGPFELEKTVVTRRRAVDDTNNSEAKTAHQVEAGDIAEAETNNTANLVRSVYGSFSRKSEGNAINFFKFFINPRSFSQSVENLFFTSFLLRDARVKLYKDEQGTPMIDLTDVQQFQAASSNPPTGDTVHHIASFDYSTWENLIRKYNITEPFLDHRDDGEDANVFDDSDEELSNDEEGNNDEEQNNDEHNDASETDYGDSSQDDSEPNETNPRPKRRRVKTEL